MPPHSEDIGPSTRVGTKPRGKRGEGWPGSRGAGEGFLVGGGGLEAGWGFLEQALMIKSWLSRIWPFGYQALRATPLVRYHPLD